MPSAFLLRASEPALQRSKAALFGCEGWELAGVSQRCAEAIERLPLLQPDLLLADQRLADGPLIRLLVQLAERRQRLPVLIWCSLPDDPRLFDSLLLGVRGFLPEPGDRRPLAALLQATLEERHELNPSLARELLRRLNTPRLAPQTACERAMAANANGAGLLRVLSIAQQALLSLLAHGWLPREIAGAWALEVAEVERRVGQLLRLLPRLLPQVQPVATIAL